MSNTGYGLSDVGRQRENNEDAFLVDDEIGLYVVADGLGGHAAGEKAARLAVSVARASIRRSRCDGELEGAELGHASLRRAAAAAVREACVAVHGAATTKPEWAGMACTVTLLLIEGRRAAMAHAGDTRLYLYRDGSVWQLSSDHTMAGELVRRGELTPAQAREHPNSSVLTRAVGAQESVEVETLVLDLFADDVLLLCSDGLTGYVERPGDLTSVLGGDNLEEAPAELISLANGRGGRDNVTAVVVAVGTDHDSETASDLAAWMRAARDLPAFKRERFANLLRLFNVSSVRNLAAGDTPVVTGELQDGLLVVLDGELEVLGGEGQELLGRGQSFGVWNLVRPEPASRTLRSHGTARVLELHTEAFRRLAHQRPRMGVELLIGLADSAQGPMAQ